MTLAQMAKLFSKHDDEYIDFEKVTNRTSNRPDLHAFNLLDKLQPGDCDIVSASEHDECWLNIDCAELAEVITEEQIIELLRCGVGYDDNFDSLRMNT